MRQPWLLMQITMTIALMSLTTKTLLKSISSRTNITNNIQLIKIQPNFQWGIIKLHMLKIKSKTCLILVRLNNSNSTTKLPWNSKKMRWFHLMILKKGFLNRKLQLQGVKRDIFKIPSVPKKLKYREMTQPVPPMRKVKMGLYLKVFFKSFLNFLELGIDLE